MNLRELARASGLPYRTVHGAVQLGLIEVASGGGCGYPIEIDKDEATRAIEAAELSLKYRLPFTEILRGQRVGRISEVDEQLCIRPVAELVHTGHGPASKGEPDRKIA